MTKYHKLSSLRQQKCMSPQLWRLEVWIEDVCRTMLLLKALRRILPCLFPASSGWHSLVCKCITQISTPSSRVLPYVCVQIFLWFLDPPLWAKILCSNYSWNFTNNIWIQDFSYLYAKIFRDSHSLPFFFFSFLRPTVIHYDLILTWLYLQKLYFQIRSHL